MNKILIAASFGLLGLTSCMKDDDAGKPLYARMNVEVTGLQDLGPAYVYQTWATVDGTPQSMGTFTVDSAGRMSNSYFTIKRDDMHNVSEVLVTAEPANGTSTTPGKARIVSGVFSGENAVLKADHLGNLEQATGNYQLATPTTSETNDEGRGIWFMANQAAGLSNLPALPAGWRYEGWIMLNGKPVSTGKFAQPTGTDEAHPFSGQGPAPQFPGEDLIANAPAGVSFPAHLGSSTASLNKVLISIEPVPDTDPARPFAFRPLGATIPASADEHRAYSLTNQAASFPAGAARR